MSREKETIRVGTNKTKNIRRAEAKHLQENNSCSDKWVGWLRRSIPRLGNN